MDESSVFLKKECCSFLFEGLGEGEGNDINKVDI